MMSSDKRVEWQTVALAAGVHALWVLVVATHSLVPTWMTIGLLAIAIAWHGSLQHEVLHGHPFSSQPANEAIGSLPLSLRLPYPIYRRYHLEHHRSVLTDPVDDAESFYLSAETWSALSTWRRRGALAHHTLLGRILIGPMVGAAKLWRSQFRAIRRGDRELGAIWARHVVVVAALLWIIVEVVGMPIWVYLIGVYAGQSLTLVRSFAEHRWVPGDGSRSAVVRSGRAFSLLFLNNNLHDAHHARPSVAWYRLPALAEELDSDAAAANGAGLYAGYRDVGRRYFVRPFDHPLHPLERAGHIVAAG
jgi:fatty acid desaturase